ncbi:efflux RND transporter permease subunit [Thermoflexibacter ruber]|uniref:AcrB/AcrD/AcrF family protein n=1 Tax=Thermoflexibacter ruber TaxID=1003 RepID=A0A1I2FW28_9BACT|nr:efflux RND transporter permease subunit [Thermoflexibacter ruber]SFF09604.1 AcrB/AcrD/AcrF family protein [Thermoflexibacter ruber]
MIPNLVTFSYFFFAFPCLPLPTMVKFLLFRPIAVLITTLSVVALGLLTFSQIPISLLPEIAIPEITVQVSYPNTSARELHKAIVKPFKNQLLQVNHLADLQAESRDGLAVIKLLSFDYGTNINLAYIETNEKIDALMGSLPHDTPPPQSHQGKCFRYSP